MSKYIINASRYCKNVIFFVLLSLLAADGTLHRMHLTTETVKQNLTTETVEQNLTIETVKQKLCNISKLSTNNLRIRTFSIMNIGGGVLYYTGEIDYMDDEPSICTVSFLRKDCQKESWSLNTFYDNNHIEVATIEKIKNETSFNKGIIIKNQFFSEIYRFDFESPISSINITSNGTLLYYVKNNNFNFDIFNILSNKYNSSFEEINFDKPFANIQIINEDYNGRTLWIVTNLNNSPSLELDPLMIMSFVHVITYLFLDYNQHKNLCVQMTAVEIMMAIILSVPILVICATIYFLNKSKQNIIHFL